MASERGPRRPPGPPGSSGAPRDYLLTRRRRVSRHVRAHGYRSLLGGTTATGVLAGFLSASEVHWQLITYIGVAAGLAAALLVALALRSRPRYGLPVLPPLFRRRPASGPATATVSPVRERPGRPAQLPAVGSGDARQVRRAAVRCDDPVYGAGLRVLLPPNRPLVVISSNRRDVGRDHELPLPLFADQGRRTEVQVDLRPFGIPLAPYEFERELPEGGQDVDHTLAVKDLVFVPELAAALGGFGGRGEGGGTPGSGGDAASGPVMLPEHCVDPMLLAERDVVVIGGPDTNFWHGALFEPVARHFETPRSPVPLALDLRDLTHGLPRYGSRSMSVRLTDLGTVFRHTREERADLDERLYPTYGMALATRNPFAAALGRSHWVLFVAGTRSLGTSGCVLGLVRMLRAMRDDDALSFSSLVPSTTPGVSARVSAALFRVTEVEQAMLRRGGDLTARTRRAMPPEGIDPRYSDSYVPVGIEYLSYDGVPATDDITAGADGPGAGGRGPRWTALPEGW